LLGSLPDLNDKGRGVNGEILYAVPNELNLYVLVKGRGLLTLAIVCDDIDFIGIIADACLAQTIFGDLRTFKIDIFESCC
jgi:hypothetical protein